MRIIHVVPAVSVEASGTSYSVVRLCQSQIDAGTQARVATLDWNPPSRADSCVETFPLGRGPRRLGISPEMRRWLDTKVRSGQFDVVHNHSLWMMPNVYPGNVCRRYGRSCLVVSPHGT